MLVRVILLLPSSQNASNTVRLQVACSRQKDNHFYGFAIGMTVLSGAMAVGKVSGGAFNPAVSTALQLAKCVVTGRCKPLGYIWLYWISHFGAAALAAGCFLTIHPRAGIKQHTGADEDNADSWTVLPSASTETIKRASQLMPRIVRASNAVEADQVPMAVDLAKTNMTDFTSSQQLPSEHLLNKS
jgi:hypothetical protein